MDDVKKTVEALLFASASPLTVDRIREILPEAEPKAIREAIETLRRDYDEGGRAFGVEELAGGYQVLTRPAHAEAVAKLAAVRADQKPSPAMLDTLAIVAYKQPITRAEIEAIRGVQSGEILRGLLERGLLRITGRAEVPGAPLLYGTTKQFLDAVGVARIQDLPKPEELK
jgi:segregation and condensation protein B